MMKLLHGRSAVEYQSEAQQAKASLGLLEKRYWKLTQDADDIRGKLVVTQSERDQLATLVTLAQIEFSSGSC